MVSAIERLSKWAIEQMSDLAIERMSDWANDGSIIMSLQSSVVNINISQMTTRLRCTARIVDIVALQFYMME